MERQGMLAAIPSWKLAFNDGEHVTVDEIERALGLAESDPMTLEGDDGVGLWHEWLVFLRHAVEHGGAIVW
jgi:hypothetical protein